MKAKERGRQRHLWEEYTQSVSRETLKKKTTDYRKHRRDDKPELSVMAVVEWIILVYITTQMVC
jgi:hypothetical protein